jgi:hypothetical protein
MASNMTEWLSIIQAEYRESPGLRLTKLQVRRMWNLDHSTCDAVLAELEAARFLRRTLKDAYVRADR